MTMLIPVIGLALGIFIGIQSGVVFPLEDASYVAIGILACLDSVLGGIRSKIDNTFHLSLFLSGFFGNGLLSIALVWLGNQLNIPLSLAAVLVFGTRLFHNFATIRHILLKKSL